METIFSRAAVLSYYFSVEFTCEIMSISNKTPCIFEARRRQLGGRDFLGSLFLYIRFLIEKDTCNLQEKF